MVGVIRRLDEAEARHVGGARNAATVETIVEQLVLNALDAGAASVAVTVDLTQYLVSVRDDGHGIALGDLPHVGQLGCTSKAGGAAENGDWPAPDRAHGHRGEALFAIGLVSTLEVVSRTAREASPYLTVVRNGNRVMTCVAAGARARGTTATVRDLFFNRPVQRKVLVKPGAIASTCERVRQLITRVALAHAHVAFSLRDAARSQLLLETRPIDVLALLRQLYRSTPERAAFRRTAASLAEPRVSVDGFACPAAHALRTTELQLVYVNRRALARRDPLVKLVAATIGRLSAAERPSPSRRAGVGSTLADVDARHPIFILFVELPREAAALLDDGSGVLAHLADERAVYECVRGALASGLQGAGEHPIARAPPSFAPSPRSPAEPPPRGRPAVLAALPSAKRRRELFERAQPPLASQRRRPAAGRELGAPARLPSHALDFGWRGGGGALAHPHDERAAVLARSGVASAIDVRYGSTDGMQTQHFLLAPTGQRSPAPLLGWPSDAELELEASTPRATSALDSSPQPLGYWRPQDDELLSPVPLHAPESRTARRRQPELGLLAARGFSGSDSDSEEERDMPRPAPLPARPLRSAHVKPQSRASLRIRGDGYGGRADPAESYLPPPGWEEPRVPRLGWAEAGVPQRADRAARAYDFTVDAPLQLLVRRLLRAPPRVPHRTPPQLLQLMP
ncbi:hypothetical protein T492DRAFT_874915, partial [Pavlovales sp. CCMP2436]